MQCSRKKAYSVRIKGQNYRIKTRLCLISKTILTLQKLDLSIRHQCPPQLRACHRSKQGPITPPKEETRTTDNSKTMFEEKGGRHNKKGFALCTSTR